MADATENLDMLLAWLEDELMQCADEDVIAAPGAAAMAQRVAALVEMRASGPREKATRPSGASDWRRRRSRQRDFLLPAKRQLVRQVLVARPEARTLLDPSDLARYSDKEVDEVLTKMKELGLLESDD